MIDLDALKALLAMMTPADQYTFGAKYIAAFRPGEPYDELAMCKSVNYDSAKWNANAAGIVALLNAAPTLIKAVQQNEQRGELLRRASIFDRWMDPQLREDIAKELKS